MPSDSRTFLVSYALEHIEAEPLKKRIKIYRALSDFVGDPARAKSLETLAADLESADRRCAEFHFQFSLKPA